jgi:hypothetical protein
MVAFRDFVHVNDGFWPSRKRGVQAFEKALVEANEWIDRESIEVINVETLGIVGSSIVRVWHRTPSPKLQPPPEV